MIDDVLSDLGICSEPIPAGEDFVEKYSSEKKLFETIEKCLHDNGIRSGYTLGRFGDHEAYSLFKYGGYWIVSFTERNETLIHGLFWTPYDVTEFFLSLLLRSNRKYFDWGEVCE
jgi:hypothetical protein